MLSLSSLYTCYLSRYPLRKLKLRTYCKVGRVQIFQFQDLTLFMPPGLYLIAATRVWEPLTWHRHKGLKADLTSPIMWCCYCILVKHILSNISLLQIEESQAVRQMASLGLLTKLQHMAASCSQGWWLFHTPYSCSKGRVVVPHPLQLFKEKSGCSIPLTSVQREEWLFHSPTQMFNGKSTCSIPSIAVQREEYMFHSPLQLLKGKAGCYMPPWQLFKWKGNYSMPPQQFKGKSGFYISSTVVQWEEYIFHPLAVQRESWLFNPTSSCSKGRMAVPPPCYTAAIQKEEWLFHTHPETVMFWKIYDIKNCFPKEVQHEKAGEFTMYVTWQMCWYCVVWCMVMYFFFKRPYIGARVVAWYRASEWRTTHSLLNMTYTESVP